MNPNVTSKSYCLFTEAFMSISLRHTFLVPFLFLLLLVGCAPASTPAPTLVSSTASPLATLAPSATPTATPTRPPSPTPTPTSTPTRPPTVTPTPTPAQTVTPTPHASPTLHPGQPTPLPPSTLNGLPYSDFILMDPAVKAHVREIYAAGQKMGRDPHAFSKLGDSLIANPYFLRVFDQKDPDLGPYNLGDYAYLQTIIDAYPGSYDRYGVAIHVGLHTWSVFDPMWADKKWCNPGENLLDCEIRLHNPSLMLVLLGTNDDAPQVTFETSYEAVVKHLIDQGIVPVLYTKADRFEGPDNRNNLSIRKIAAKYQVPLLDFDILADTLPHHGLGPDGIHLSIAPSNDYRLSETFRYGNTVHNLASLIMLERIQHTLTTVNPTPTPTPRPATPTPHPTPTPTPPPTPTPRPAPTSLNGLPYAQFILMDDAVKAHVREIYAQGQTLGRDPHAFSKLGDSLIANPYFVRIFDQMDPNLGPYNLGDYAYLQDTIDYYRGSFDRRGAAVRVGLHTWSVFDPMWADKSLCNPGENLLDCEIRLHNPSVMVVLLGTNDNVPRSYFEKHYDKIVRYLLDQGIVPILFTKADRHEGEDNHNNQAVRAIAQKYQVPLVDFDILADTLPNRGLGPDNTHLRVARSHDFTDPQTFQYGTSVHNLATLIALDQVRHVLMEDATNGSSPITDEMWRVVGGGH